MPSPFPGMDPYLEGDLWQEFHDRLANQISAQLMPLVAPKYVALLGKRYVLDRPSLGILDLSKERIFYPDVHLLKRDVATATQTHAAGIAVAEPTAEIPSLMDGEVPILSVEIRDVAQRRLVTSIEILSPVNKRGEGAREYATRRDDPMRTATHILEIDLLRGGLGIPLGGRVPLAPYYVYLSRTERRSYTQVWVISLREPLPVVPAPLLPPDPDVPLDLQAALNACFELVGYERLLDYSAPPPPPDSPAEDAAWVADRLRAAGAPTTNAG